MVIGPIIIVVLVVFVIPPLFLIGGLAFSAILGWLLVDEAEGSHAGSELIDCNY